MSFRENTVKIVSTLGPASSSKEMLEKLINAGVDIFRLNFSHGTYQEKKELTERIREISKLTKHTGILADIQGPKIRVGEFKDDESYSLAIGQEVRVFEKEVLGDLDQFSIPLPGFLKSIRIGDVFFVNDGIIKIKVIKKEQDHIVGEVLLKRM
jgi:pyruvate kinase